jgi:hypothetical protein
MQLDVECDDGFTMMVNVSIYKRSLGMTLICTLTFCCCSLVCCVRMSLCSFSNFLLAREFGLH